MFDKSGISKAIKFFGSFLAVFGIVGSIILGVYWITDIDALGWVIVLGGVIFFAIVFCFFYGFAEIIEKLAEIAELLGMDYASEEMQIRYKTNKTPQTPLPNNKTHAPSSTNSHKKTIVLTDEPVSNQYYDTICPKCSENLSFIEADADEQSNVVCPYCENKFFMNFNQSQK